MTKRLAVILALACATLHAQSVTVKGTGAGAVHATGAGSVRGVIPPYTNYSDGRFTVWSDSTNLVVDNDSGLTWARNANIDGKKDWTNAMTYCTNLTYAGSSDWRLPSITEFSRYLAQGGSTTGLVDSFGTTNSPALPPGHPFTSVQLSGYWSSTPFVDPDRAVSVNPNDGSAGGSLLVGTAYVWPCRGP